MTDRDVTVDATWRDRTSAGTRATGRNLDEVKRKADGMRGALSKVADDWGRGFNRLADRAKRWSESGDTVGKRWTRGVIGGLSGLAAAGGKIGGALSSAVDAAGPHVKAALVGVLAAAALAATPAIGAAIVGAAGLGGVVGGLVLASRDARVKAAFAGLSEDVGARLGDAASAFVPAALKAVTTARLYFAGLEPDLRRIFDRSATFVQPLVHSIGRAAQAITRGVAIAVDKAGPVISAIGDGIVMMGREVEHLFGRLSDNGESMALALRGVFSMVAGGIRVATEALNALVETFEFLVRRMPGGEKLLASMSKSLGDAGSSVERLSGGFQAAAEDAELAAAGITKVQEAAAAAADANLSLREAQIRSKEAMIEAGKVIAENGAKHGLNSAKARENEQAIIAMARAFNTEAEAGQRSGQAAAEAQAAYERNRKALIDQAVAAGYTREKAAELAAQYLRTPNTVNTQVRLSGAQAALNAIQNLRSEAERFRGTYTATMRLNYVTYGKPYSAHTGIGGSTARGYDAATGFQAASGGTHRTGGPTPVRSEVSVAVNLDGAPFRQMTAVAVADEQARQAWRAKVGRR